MKKTYRADIAVVAEPGVAELLATALAPSHPRVVVVRWRSALEDDGRRLAYVGNGECRENARRIFGVGLQELMWEISELSLERALSLSRRFPAAVRACRLGWIASNDKEASLLSLSAGKNASWEETDERRALIERACVVDWPALGGALQSELAERGVVSLTAVDVALDGPGSALGTRLVVRGNGEAVVEASMAIVVSERVTGIAGFVHDKLVPVTLTRATAPSAALPADLDAALFHLGADFAVKLSPGVAFGSFRNLYQDRAVGFQRTPDPVTMAGVKSFFSGLGWLKGDELEAGLSLEALPCDGLPLVGTLPDQPCVYVAAGFSGRASNYLFELLPRLAESVVRATPTGLDPFSTKRFV